jgi:hypothetical protein
VAGLARVVLGGNRGGGSEGENGEQEAAMNLNREERFFALSALPTSHERGLIGSRSDELTVAVGFIPRLGAPDDA